MKIEIASFITLRQETAAVQSFVNNCVTDVSLTCIIIHLLYYV